MVTYRRIDYKKNDATGYRYTKDNVFVKEERVPQEVMDLFQHKSEVEFDDQPDKSRCLFCDAAKEQQRYLNGLMIDLCNYHYQNKTLGSIAAQVRTLNEEAERKLQDGNEAKVPKRGKIKSHKSKVKATI